MSGFSRRRSRLHFPVTISVVLMVLNIVLMVCWIVLLSYRANFSMLTIGTILFVLILIGLTVYLLFSIKEVRLNQRQANFVDSVTHELRSPIASLRLYLETLQMRDVDVAQRQEFYRMMSEDIRRLDHLINQLLEVSRLMNLVRRKILKRLISSHSCATARSPWSVATNCRLTRCLRSDRADQSPGAQIAPAKW